MGRPVTREVVGVVGDVRATALDSEPREEFYIPYAQSGATSVTFVIRTDSDPARLIPVLQQQVWEADAGQAIYYAAPMDSLISTTLAERRFHLTLIASFSVVALALALVGIFGVTLYNATARSREFGVRLALGNPLAHHGHCAEAKPGARSNRRVSRNARDRRTKPIHAQHAVRVSPTDPQTYVSIGALMLIASLAAALLPAWKATEIGR